MLTVLHTADWHLGHSLHGISREYEHRCFLRWLVTQLQDTCADALIIAGDIFDSANPSANAQSLFYDFLVQARHDNPALDIVIIGGNHDSAARLDAPAAILKSLGIKVVGGLISLSGDALDNMSLTHKTDWQRLIVPLTDQAGHVRAICGAMPFIRNADLPVLTGEPEAGDPLIAGVAELYQHLYAQMQKYKIEQNLEHNIAQIVTGHCYMVGTELSELSERRILGGNQHALPGTIFNQAIDYVALGHLHKCQQVKTRNRPEIRYSGSPIPLSFAENNYQHSVLKINFETMPASVEKQIAKENESAIATKVDTITIPRAVAMKVLPENGFVTLAKLEALITAQNFQSVDNDTAQDSKNFPMLEIRLELEKPEPGLRQQVETLLQGKAVRLLKIATHYPGKGEVLAEQQPLTRLEELHPEDVFQQCYERNFAQAVPEEMLALFNQLLESVEEKA